MKRYLLIVFICCDIVVLSQSNSNIIGFASNQRYDFNYNTTVVEITPMPGSINGLLGNSTYDPYRRIVYYYDSYKRICSYNVNQNITAVLYNLNINISDIHYDMFLNCIFLRSPQYLYKYDIVNNNISIQCNLPNHYFTAYSGNPQSYDPYTKRYSFLAMLSSNYNYEKERLVQVDIINNSIIDTVPPLEYQLNGVHNSGSWWQYSFRNHNLYVIQNEIINTNTNIYYLAILNLSNGSFQNLLQLPNDFNGSLNAQRGVFDQQSNIFLLPYYTVNSTCKLIIANLNSMTLVSIPFICESEFNQADYFPSPVLVFSDDTLRANYFTNYTWYLDSTLIVGVNSQNIYPDYNGTYYYTTVDTIGNIYFSNSITINNVGIKKLYQNIIFFPNVIHKSGFVKITGTELNNFKVKLYDICGKIYSIIAGYNNCFYIDNILNSGMYYFEVFDEKQIINGRIIYYSN